MEIEKIVEKKFSEIIESGFIEEKIKKTLEKTISELIEESLKSWSDFGKGIKSSIEEALKIEKLDLELPEYNQLVSNWIIEMVNNTIITDSKKQIEENIKKFFKPLEKDEYKISEIIEEFKKTIMEDEDYCEGEITFIEGENLTLSCPSYIYFYFDEEPNKSKYSCDYSFGINEKGLWRMSIKGTDCDKMKHPTLFNFDSFMFQLYASKVKIINDAGEVETCYSNSDY